MTSNTGRTSSIRLASSTIISMRARATTSLPKPVSTMEFVAPAGSICWVFWSVIIVRIEFDS